MINRDMRINNFVVDEQQIIELKRFGFTTDVDVIYQDVFKWLDDTHGIHVSFRNTGFLRFPNEFSASFSKVTEVVHENGGTSGHSGMTGHSDFGGKKEDYTEEDLLRMEKGIISGGLNDIITFMKREYKLYEIKN